MFRENEWINGQTGEVGQAFLVIKGKKFPKGMDFMVMFAEGWRDLATWRDLDGRRLAASEWAVLAGLLAHLDFENVVTISQARLAEELEMAAPNVARAVKRLEQASVIERAKAPNDRRRTLLRLNPRIGWRGKAPAWQKAIQTRDNAQGRGRSGQEDIETFLAEHLGEEREDGAEAARATPQGPADLRPNEE